ncbi:hypothetical protein [Micromonospora deserti]|uniref:Uncharacterized protein n=1 Tax=Micromonospora deserti TaxID=2070366 RepID=A0A2W2D4D9_9ACTN|nr:hypothetical protein [Micromonospora deserti]PZF98518.1 hypothetical protein C1I99_13230 [Micromonospora deserti]
MTAADIVLLLLVVLFAGTTVLFAWLWHRRPAPRPSLNAQARTACAPLQPDHPALPELPFAERVELRLALNTKES